MKFSFIQIKQPNKSLKELLKKLECPPGYGQGIYVRKVEGVPGKFRIEYHRGTITDSVDCVRIDKRGILTKNSTVEIKRLLEKNNIGYEEFGVETRNPNARKLELNYLKQSPTTTYNP